MCNTRCYIRFCSTVVHVAIVLRKPVRGVIKREPDGTCEQLTTHIPNLVCLACKLTALKKKTHSFYGFPS